MFTTRTFPTRRREETAEGIKRDMAVSYLNRLVIFNAIAPRMGRDHTIGARALSRALTQPVGPSTP